MLAEILFAVIVGVCCGIFTGLIPGIHINLISVLLLSISPVLLQYTGLVALCCFVISMSVTHSFLDSIPSVFLGAPSSDTAMGVLPGHRYLLKGLGETAVKLTLVGSFGAVILSIVLFPLLMPVITFSYPYLEAHIAKILIVVVLFMIIRDSNRFWAFFIFVCSGILGIVSMNIPNFDNPLFPLFSGLFGTSTLLLSLFSSESVPEQLKKQPISIPGIKGLKALFSGCISGFITAVMPGLGASTAAVLSMQIARDLDDEGFMVLMGSINTFNFILSIATFYTLNKARNGSIIAVQKLIGEISMQHIFVFLCAVAVAGSLAVFAALFFSKVFSRLFRFISYKKLVVFVVLLITGMVIGLTGFLGLLILVTATAVGFLPPLAKVSRTHAMGCLLLPVILFFTL